MHRLNAAFTWHGLPPLYRYMAVPLAEFFLSRKRNITGTVCMSFLPAWVKRKLPKGDSIAFRKNNVLCIGWHDKKHVILLSTEGSSKMITYTSKRNQEHTMPELVRDYNLHMGGWLNQDLLTKVFPVIWKSRNAIWGFLNMF